MTGTGGLQERGSDAGKGMHMAFGSCPTGGGWGGEIMEKWLSVSPVFEKVGRAYESGRDIANGLAGRYRCGLFLVSRQVKQAGETEACNCVALGSGVEGVGRDRGALAQEIGGWRTCEAKWRLVLASWWLVVTRRGVGRCTVDGNAAREKTRCQWPTLTFVRWDILLQADAPLPTAKEGGKKMKGGHEGTPRAGIETRVARLMGLCRTDKAILEDMPCAAKQAALAVKLTWRIVQGWDLLRVQQLHNPRRALEGFLVNE